MPKLNMNKCKNEYEYTRRIFKVSEKAISMWYCSHFKDISMYRFNKFTGKWRTDGHRPLKRFKKLMRVNPELINIPEMETITINYLLEHGRSVKEVSDFLRIPKERILA